MSAYPELAAKIRDVPDFPRPGIVFKDVMPLLADPGSLRQAVEGLAAFGGPLRPDVVLGAESRGFILGGALAYRLGCGFTAARKPGKLPWKTVSVEYALEYGVDDDVLATGGTARAKVDLVERLGGIVVGLAFLIELRALGGRERVDGYPMTALVPVD